MAATTVLDVTPSSHAPTYAYTSKAGAPGGAPGDSQLAGSCRDVPQGCAVFAEVRPALRPPARLPLGVRPPMLKQALRRGTAAAAPSAPSAPRAS
jgi:hypothetical protein